MNCKQATELASRQKDAPLALGQKVNLKLHLLMCKHCQNFNKNIEQLSQAMKGFLKDETNNSKKTQNNKVDESSNEN